MVILIWPHESFALEASNNKLYESDKVMKTEFLQGRGGHYKPVDYLQSQPKYALVEPGGYGISLKYISISDLTKLPNMVIMN